MIKGHQVYIHSANFDELLLANGLASMNEDLSAGKMADLSVLRRLTSSGRSFSKREREWVGNGNTSLGIFLLHECQRIEWRILRVHSGQLAIQLGQFRISSVTRFNIHSINLTWLFNILTYCALVYLFVRAGFSQWKSHSASRGTLTENNKEAFSACAGYVRSGALKVVESASMYSD